MTETALDRAHAAMVAAPEDGGARLAFYHCLADAELYLLLTEEPEGDHISPRTFPVDGAEYALAFDNEERLAAFTGQTSAYAALSGRALAQMLAGAGAGLGLNLDVAPSSILLPPGALGWLTATLGQGGAQEADMRPHTLTAPGDLPQALLTALDAKLARMGGLAHYACLAGTRTGDGQGGLVLVFVGAAPGAEQVLTRAVSEALTFSGVDAGALDIGFADPGSELAGRVERVGLRFDLPRPEAAAPRAAPGTDPDRPPRLK